MNVGKKIYNFVKNNFEIISPTDEKSLETPFSSILESSITHWQKHISTNVLKCTPNRSVQNKMWWFYNKYIKKSFFNILFKLKHDFIIANVLKYKSVAGIIVLS